MKQLTVFTDGGARGNPGPAACAAVVYERLEGVLKKIDSFSKFLGRATNNQAEYAAVILALEKLMPYKEHQFNFFLDSELVVQQLNGEYKVKDPELGKLFLKVWNLKAGYQQITFQHVVRSKNKEADRLVNVELDKAA
ncbi:MAG: ribonuclease HI family protein [Candidatus Komeilibacteria bacterium]|nr:ribonuclease HI family protein [Candidatus Komeilibacteria bacterium]